MAKDIKTGSQSLKNNYIVMFGRLLHIQTAERSGKGC